jgi:hypothetical protein
MPGNFAKLSPASIDLDVAWQDRLDDARTLQSGARYAAAISAGLYALEIYLKSRVCLRLNLTNLPRILEIHDLEALAIYSGFDRSLNRGSAPSSVKKNWSKIVLMSDSLNDLRYQPTSNWSQNQAIDFLKWLIDPNDGVITWLMTQI